MRKAIAAAMLAMAAFTLQAQEKSRMDRLVEHVYYFASDSLNGRKAGSPDAAKAAEYIRKEYEAAGLKPFFKDWFMDFTDHSLQYRNVVGCIEGSDPVLRNEYILLGAHYDHLGVTDGQVYNGADDNASGSAALIEVARMLCQDPSSLRRSVIIAAFDAEEIGLVGSSALADSLKKMGVNVRLAMSVDMVGWLREGKSLTLEGVATIRNGKGILQKAAVINGLAITPKNFEKSLMTATDTEGFAEKGIPTLALTTGLKSPYHKPEDDAELIDYEGLDKITGYIGDITTEFATDESFGPSGRLSFKHRSKSNVGLDFGPVVKFSANSISHPQSGISTKGRHGVSAGLGVELSLGMISITADGTIGKDWYNLVNEDDIYGSALKMDQTVVRVPVCINLRTPRYRKVAAEIGFGAYWSQVLSESLSGSCRYETNSNPWGLVFRLGYNVYNFNMGLESDWQKNSFFVGENVPKTSRESTSLFLKWNF